MILPDPLPLFSTSVSEGGLAIARQIATIYQAYPDVRAFIVGGSVSRGCADEYSDLEIGVFWEGTVPQEERRDAIDHLGGDLWTMDRDGRFMEHFGLYALETEAGKFTGSCMVSMNHTTVAAMESTLTAVLDRHETSAELQELIFAVQNAVTLQGEELVANWQHRAVTFPEELAARIVQENLSFGPWFIPESYILRKDPLVLYRHFLTIEQHLVRLLLGLNRLYLPSSEFKWLDQSLKRMKIAPTKLPERLRSVFQTQDLFESWRELKALMFETLDLVDQHLPRVNSCSLIPNRPEINTQWARQCWNPLPPYMLMKAIGEGSNAPR